MKKTIIGFCALLCIIFLISCNGSVDEKLFESKEPRTISFDLNSGDGIFTFSEDGLFTMYLVEEDQLETVQISSYYPTLFVSYIDYYFYKDSERKSPIVSFEDLDSCKNKIWALCDPYDDPQLYELSRI